MGDSGNHIEHVPKRRKTSPVAKGGRRKTACQSCSLRKVKCDNARPECLSCQATGYKCIYLKEPEESLTLNHVVEILSNQIGGLATKLDTLADAFPRLQHHCHENVLNAPNASIHDGFELVSQFPDSITEQRQEPSRNFSHIPSQRTSADEVLTWPIFENAFPSNYLIGPHVGGHFRQRGNGDDEVESNDIVIRTSHNTAPLDEHRIPALVDKFLENVHTKNPILDVEALVRKGRQYASEGLGWGGYSCLVLMACALGLIAKPFVSETQALDHSMSLDAAKQIAAPSREKDQADNCFVQACRRLGALKPSILTAQCHFFAGVYLMYTLRPMFAWQYFHQASMSFQLYLRMNGRVLDDNTLLTLSAKQPELKDSTSARLEQRMYWSCFKSEAEFRVELPLPQSEIAAYDFPNLFPSPPSPVAADERLLTAHSTSPMSENLSASTPSISQLVSKDDNDEIKIHAKRFCNEEESWYYYLTEVALRRIGNRVINTFFRQDRSQWLSIERFLGVALEFEAQVSTWQTNLPPAMQKYETDSTIRAPRLRSPSGADAGFVSRELSWATENRLLEMRQWLYQPFLYYLVHARPVLPTHRSSEDIHLQQPSHPIFPGGSDEDHHKTFWNLIVRAIECNLSILETRSIPHRHHGLWYDLRAVTCSSLILLAVVKSGYVDLIPGGTKSLIGDAENVPPGPGTVSITDGSQSARGDASVPRIRGKFGRILRQLEVWSDESTDIDLARKVLTELIWQIMEPN